MEHIYKTNNQYHRENQIENLPFADKDDKEAFDFLNELDFSIQGKVVLKNKIKKITHLKHEPMVSKHWRNLNINIKTTISNYSLALDKFARYKKDKLEYIDFSGEDNLHHEFINKSIIPIVQKKEERIKNNLKTKNHIIDINLQQTWRMVLGLGITTGYNNGFLLHKLYGIPYLPGSAIKGLIRTYTIQEYFNYDENEAMKNKDFVFLFGSNDELGEINQMGKVRFASVFPVNNDFKLVADIMNNHNSNYYKPDGKLPSDSENPNPLKFLTLKNTCFKPYFYLPNTFSTINVTIGSNSNDILGMIEQLAYEAFELEGIGAKTNVGYGRFIKSNCKKEKKETVLKDGLYLGTVKFFNHTKGFGFITEKDTEKDTFVHISVFDEGVTINEGDKVIYNIVKGEKGLQAANVKIIYK